MDSDALFRQLEASASTIRCLIHGLSREHASWKSDLRKWSILETMVHLLDEERADFRVRLDILLHRPGDPWPGIDPEGWVTEREYAKRDLQESLETFLEERAKSIEWLRGLPSPEWNNSDSHPIAGTFHAGDMLAAWVAHDLLHIGQLARLHVEYLRHVAAPYSLRYATGGPPPGAEGEQA